ncbi:MAG: hypothetical protein ACOH2B_05640 [Burkholderiaceae bacterium]
MFSSFINIFESAAPLIESIPTEKNHVAFNVNCDIEEKVRMEFKIFENYISDFIDKSKDDEFNKMLLGELEQLAKEIVLQRIKVVNDTAIEELIDIEKILSGNSQEPTIVDSTELNLLSIITKKTNVFFDAFVSKNTKSLMKISNSINILENATDGGKYCLTEKDSCNEKGRKKIQNAVKSFAYTYESEREYPSEPCGFIALFDTTAFGSATNGILFTNDSVFYKGLGDERKFYKLENIRKIQINDDVLIINGTEFRFFHREIKSRLKLVVGAIDEYINQPSNILKKHVENNKNPYANR